MDTTLVSKEVVVRHDVEFPAGYLVHRRLP
jgi:hypothetical protein